MQPTTPLALTLALAAPLLAQAQPFMPMAGDDSILVNGNPSPQATHEMWQRCAEGQQWSGGTCTGTATLYTASQLAAAITAANAENGGAGRNGYNDWRRPGYSELAALHNPGAGGAPYTYATDFPNTPASVFWAEDLIPGMVSFAVDFGSSNASATIAAPGGNPLRLVRGGSGYHATATAQPPEAFSALAPAERRHLPQATGTTFTVTPRPGWQVDSASTSTTDGSCQPIVDKSGLTDRSTVTVLNMQSDCAIAITLARIPGVWRVGVQQPPAAQGRIDCPATVSSAAPATCTAQPEPGYVLAAWGDDCAGASGSTCTLASPGRDAMVSARFMASTALTLAASPASPSAAGVPVTFTATLSGAASPTGTVTFKDGAATLCTVPAAPYTCTATPLTGAHGVTASYAGDAGHAAASAALAHQVDAAAFPVSGGTATVSVAGPAGCTFARLALDGATPADSLPARATAPLGVLRFAATGCTGATLQVQVRYPAGSLAGLAPHKHGPHGGQTGWFAHGAASGDTVAYTVADNGDGDNDPAPGVIADPFAPLLLGAAPPAGAQAIPTLSQWGVLLLSLLMGLLGWRRSREKTARSA